MPANLLQRGKLGDQRYAGKVKIKKGIRRLKVPNWKTLVQHRGRWKEVVEKVKPLH